MANAAGLETPNCGQPCQRYTALMPWLLALVLGIASAFAVQAAVQVPDIVLVPVALCFVYGFENLLRSERLSRWWNGPA